MPETLTRPEARELMNALNELSAGDTVHFKTDAADHDIDALQVWGVDETDDGVLVNFDDPDSIDPTDWSTSLEYLRVSLHDDHRPRPAARLESFDGADANHIGRIDDIEPADDGVTVTWTPY
ncbi:hypothetical protein [Salinibaculum rarum]|uniref:hypothetical protein n=1 Tax=Salinibaculum rarum TaxID=3058903 RepID=UPI00265EB8EC|nr:hypothetical protein [Salinibaculum sp. KK48]